MTSNDVYERLGVLARSQVSSHVQQLLAAGDKIRRHQGLPGPRPMWIWRPRAGSSSRSDASRLLLPQRIDWRPASVAAPFLMLGSVAPHAMSTWHTTAATACGRRRRNVPMNNNKVVAIVLGAVAALFALSLLMRFVLLSEYGVPGGWMYFGLPIGGIGLVVVLLRLGLLNFGGRSGGHDSALALQQRYANAASCVSAARRIGSSPPPAARDHARKRRDLRRGIHRQASADHLQHLNRDASVCEVDGSLLPGQRRQSMSPSLRGRRTPLARRPVLV